MRRVLLTILAIGLLAGVTTSVVFALNYEGEDFCQDTPAWPNGTYLGQMHPYHSDFYRGFAERRGWDPCTTWAADQRNSAIRGLRELGYAVTALGTPPVEVQQLGPMGLYGQCRNAAGIYVRIINVSEGLWTCYGVVVSNRAYFGNIELVNSGEGLHLPSGTPIKIEGLYFLGNPRAHPWLDIQSYHTEKGLDPAWVTGWSW